MKQIKYHILLYIVPNIFDSFIYTIQIIQFIKMDRNLIRQDKKTVSTECTKLKFI